MFSSSTLCLFVWWRGVCGGPTVPPHTPKQTKSGHCKNPTETDTVTVQRMAPDDTPGHDIPNHDRSRLILPIDLGQLRDTFLQLRNANAGC